ncbi:hypothetical protein RFI_17260, partial [Reticulomyxa filosa]
EGIIFVRAYDIMCIIIKKKKKNALTQVKEMNSSLNACMKEMEQRQAVRDIERRFGANSGVTLLSPSRRLIREGILDRVTKNGKIIKHTTFFLFNDALVYATGSDNHLTFHQLLPFDSAFSVRNLENHPTYQNCAFSVLFLFLFLFGNGLFFFFFFFFKTIFQVHSSVKSFVTIAENETTKNDWVQTIQSQSEAFSKGIEKIMSAKSKSANSNSLPCAGGIIVDAGYFLLVSFTHLCLLFVLVSLPLFVRLLIYFIAFLKKKKKN